jgi:hypothetical protein
MKWLFIALLTTNLVFYSIMQAREQRRTESLSQHHQVNETQIRLIGNRLHPEPQGLEATADLSIRFSPEGESSCVEWSNLTAEAVARARPMLAALQLGEKLTERAATESTTYWVYIPPLPNLAAAQKKISELKALDVEDSFLIQDGTQWQYGVSLGVFSTEGSAIQYLEVLRGKGVRSAKTGRYEPSATLPEFIIKNPTGEILVELEKLSKSFAGSTLRDGKCDSFRAAATR